MNNGKHKAGKLPLYLANGNDHIISNNINFNIWNKKLYTKAWANIKIFG